MFKKEFDSLFGSKSKLTAPQFLAELICKKSAEIQGIDLPNIFWKNPSFSNWKRRLCTEIIAANKLLKLFSAEAIVRALRNKRASKVQSLHNKCLPEIIQQEERHIEAVEKIKEEFILNNNTTSMPIKNRKKKTSLINKLRD